MSVSPLTWLQARVAPVADCHLDSRELRSGDIFLACPGEVHDGRDFIRAAVAAGAGAVLYEAETPLDPAVLEHLQEHAVPSLGVVGLGLQAAQLAAQWYDHPSRELTVVAVTGTNGKTSCTQWLARSLQALGVPCGVIGTLGSRLPNGDYLATALTTPDGVSMQRVLARMRAAGAQVVALEASSIGLAQGRLDAVQIAYAGFTNFSRDHLDYHGDMQAYAAAKGSLFTWQGLKGAVINADDSLGRELISRVPGLPVLAYSHRSTALAAGSVLRAEEVACHDQRLVAELRFNNGAPVTFSAPVLGLHNLENLLLVTGLLLQLGYDLPQLQQTWSQVQAVPGRLQPVSGPSQRSSQPLVVVDYAHTPEALERVLQTLRPIAEHREGQLICVFGCGGNRDAGKRPLMGAVVSGLADVAWVTSDNPRHEDPLTIIEQIESGRPDCSNAARGDTDGCSSQSGPDAGARTEGEAAVWHREVERARAILLAVSAAHDNDVVLIAGKGHEQEQVIGDQALLFRDEEWARLGLWLPVLGPVISDSRQVVPGALFVALEGEVYDGNAFVAQALKAGAAAAVVANAEVAAQAGGTCFVLGSGRAALAHLAAARRRAYTGPLVAVTGSNGKTTTKEMIAAIFRAWLGADAVLATRGNLNNEIGVPLTLLGLHAGHQAAVLELGMNHPGEIAQLAALAQPTVALVNNAQREHQEFMQTVEAVAEENGNVLQALPAEGLAVYPGDDPHTSLWRQLAGQRPRLEFGLVPGLDVVAELISLAPDGSQFRLLTPQGEAVVSLPVAGLHNVRNALAATACALAVACPLHSVVQGLESFAPVAGRLAMTVLANGVHLIDDTYNANPDSVRAAIDVLASLPGPRLLVLGDMGEVGDDGPQVHAEVGAYARERGIEGLVCLGTATLATVKAFGQDASHAASVEETIRQILHRAPASVLFKGSRFMRMELVLQGYRQALGKDGESGHAA